MRENGRKERWRKEGRVGWRERRNEGKKEEMGAGYRKGRGGKKEERIR